MPDSEHGPDLSRREALLACGAAAAGLGLADSLPASDPHAERRPLKVRNLIWIQVNGGLSHLDPFPPKPTAPDGIRSPYRTIATRLPGVRFTGLLPRLAAAADRVRLIRGMQQISPASAHTDGSHRIMTGQSD